MYRNYILRMTLSLIVLMSGLNIASAQSNNNLNKAWSLNVNFGPSLLWGDMSDDVDFPISKMFSSETKMSYGVLARKGLNDVFGVNLQFIVGNLKGNRDYWSDGSPTGGFTSETFYTDFNANLDIDIINIFAPKDLRLINPYLKGGIGFTYFKANVTKQGVDYNGSEQSALSIPFGGGLRFDLSRNFGITLETTLHYTSTDLLDGFSTVNSQANDWFSYTSLGLTYRFASKKQIKEPSYEEETQIEEVISVVEPEQPYVSKKDLTILADIPSEIFQGDTFIVMIKINKGDYTVNGKMKFQQTYPPGFKVVEGTSAGGRFEYLNNTLNYWWNEVPQGDVIKLSYTVTTNEAQVGDRAIPSLILYTQDSVDRVKNISNNITVKSFATKDEVLTVQRQSLLVYRVQIQAIYGGKTTAEDMQSRYNIDKAIRIDYEGGYTKYTAGGFATYEDAKAFRDNMRNNGAPGAFVVGYYDDSRIKHISQAIEIENSDQQVMVVAPPPTENTNDIYRIQIAASSINRSSYQIMGKYNISQEVSKSFSGGLYKYTVGKYDNYTDAKAKLIEIRKQIPDAFIVVDSQI